MALLGCAKLVASRGRSTNTLPGAEGNGQRLDGVQPQLKLVSLKPHLEGFNGVSRRLSHADRFRGCLESSIREPQPLYGRYTAVTLGIARIHTHVSAGPCSVGSWQ